MNTQFQDIYEPVLSYDDNGLVDNVTFSVALDDESYSPKDYTIGIDLVELAFQNIKHLCPKNYNTSNIVTDAYCCEIVLKECIRLDNELSNVVANELESVSVDDNVVQVSMNLAGKVFASLLVILLILCSAIGVKAQYVSAEGWQSRTDYKELANVVSEVYDIPSELITAIARLESGNYNSVLVASHRNFFGIKDCRDCEEYEEFFCAEECFFHFGSMLRRVYSECLDQEISKIVLCMSKKYSEDINWYGKVMALIEEEKSE